MEHMMIDITIIRAHACAGGYRKKVKIKKLWGGVQEALYQRSIRLVDDLENPLKFLLTPGQRQDITHAQALISTL